MDNNSSPTLENKIYDGIVVHNILLTVEELNKLLVGLEALILKVPQSETEQKENYQLHEYLEKNLEQILDEKPDYERETT